MEKKKKKYYLKKANQIFFIALTLFLLSTVHNSTKDVSIQPENNRYDVEGMECFTDNNSRICYASYEILNYDTGIPLLYVVQNPEESKSKIDYLLEILEN